MDELGGLLMFFLLILPLLDGRSYMSSWLWLKTCCRISAFPVAVGGAGYLGGTLFTIFY